MSLSHLASFVCQGEKQIANTTDLAAPGAPPMPPDPLLGSGRLAHAPDRVPTPLHDLRLGRRLQVQGLVL